ncbi:MAG: TetR/AcrR family transcriptional regulator [Polyangiaceae bacterium]|nr:TetR/AcrR family transcriptional regulator [Polyangiaceae bacterium]
MKNGSDDSSTRAPSSSPEARSEATRTQILDAAETLFAERGFAGTSMRTLAVAAGTSQALLHHHFGTKAGLYEAVKQRFTDRYDAQRTQARTIDTARTPGAFSPPKVLDEVKRYFEFLQQNPNLSRLIAWARLEGDSAPWGGMSVIWAEVQDWLERGKKVGLLPERVDPGLLMVLGAASVQYWFDHRDVLCRAIGIDENDETLDARYLKHSVDVLLYGTVQRGRPGESS